ncbi:hypothetical protein [Pedobacter sp. ASV12]|uniref:hypothetical protein n=1 Tax=Pedobacter sp. ASV12 TaxID=2795120 RepID=UPI0018EAAE31|nr:hypothetical protein [Pedobacter sp. ASV12]
MKSIVIITSGQPATNPRLVKEADTLVEAGYEVKVIYQYRDEWAAHLDKQLLVQKKWEAICVGGTPVSDKWLYLLTRLHHKIAQLFLKRLGFKSLAALGRCTPLLIKKAKKTKANLYIAHNLAALPVAVKAAKTNQAMAGFDAEDFHRYEETDNDSDPLVKLKIAVEDQYIPQLDYLTVASPLIGEAYTKLYPQVKNTTILNTFGIQQLAAKKTKSEQVLKLFWFSQTIGANRGLESVIEAMGLAKPCRLQLHLLGAYQEATQAYFDQIAVQHSLTEGAIVYHHPIPEQELFSFAQQFDIGLATEIGYPKNRDICLTNKIFTYVQAGLCIVASNTTAQQQLMSAYPGMGLTFGSAKELAAMFATYANNPVLLRTHQQQALKYAHETLNWEEEQKKFLFIIKQLDLRQNNSH